jgi:hypothetical protein
MAADPDPCPNAFPVCDTVADCPLVGGSPATDCVDDAAGPGFKTCVYGN